MKLLPNPLQNLNNAGLVSAYSSRDAGNMSMSYGDTSRAIENRKAFLSALNINYQDLVCARQVHGKSVKYVSGVDQGKGALTYATSIADTDGLVTDIRNLPLAIFTADCLSIFLYDPQRPAIGLIHAGWRGAQENIAGAALKLMRDKFKTDPSQLYVGFGPCIRDCCYEVSAEFKANFASGMVERDGRFFLDLAAVNKTQLLSAGVKEENIFDPGTCTSCETQGFFSFRREGALSGRMLSVMALK